LTTALLATYGGTGKSTYAAGDITYAATANPTALTSLAVGSNGYVLQITSNLPSWGVLDGGTF
jgi:microcystin-dependent protein